MLLAVKHTATRTITQREIMDIEARLGTLEMQYLVETKSLTLERATELGFVVLPASSVSSVHAHEGSRFLSLKTSN